MLLRVSAVFSPYLSLKYITYFFSVCSLPDLSLFPACCRVSSSCFPPLVLRSSCPLCVPWLLCVSCCVLLCSPSPCLDPSSVCAPEALRRPSACPVVCPLAAAVTRQPSGARRCGSVGRCTAYMSPAVSVSPLAYVLPCVPLLVPWLVLPAAVCRLVAIIGGTPLYPGRRLCGAASAM